MKNKLSLHDFLGMLIPGCFWILVFLQWKFPNYSFIDNQYIKIFAFLSIGYFIGLIWHMIAEFLFQPFLSISLHFFYGLGVIAEKQYWNIDGDNIKDKYYYAYEYVQQNSKNVAIKFVEGQVLLLRNYSLPLAIWLKFCFNIEHASLFIISMCVISIILMFIRQMTVYRLIFEELVYLKKIKYNNEQYNN